MLLIKIRFVLLFILNTFLVASALAGSIGSASTSISLSSNTISTASDSIGTSSDASSSSSQSSSKEDTVERTVKDENGQTIKVVIPKDFADKITNGDTLQLVNDTYGQTVTINRKNSYYIVKSEYHDLFGSKKLN